MTINKKKTYEQHDNESINYYRYSINNIILPSNLEYDLDADNKNEIIVIYIIMIRAPKGTILYDIRKKPDQLEFTYQVVDEDGVKYLKFLVDGFESININENE